MNTIQIRHDLAANWTSVNPILAVGEMGYETDTGKVKFGDGTTTWTGLPYFTAAGSGDMLLAGVQTVTGAKTFGTIGGAVGKFILAGSTSGSTILNAAAVAGTTTVTLPGATDTLVGKATTDILTNKTYDTAGTGNSFSINGVAVTANTGTGSVVRATSPTLITPDIGTPSAGTLTNCTGFPTANLSGLGSGVATFLATPSSANLASAVTGETGTGALVFGTAPTLGKPVINGTDPTGATYTPSSGAQNVAIDCSANNMHIVTCNNSGTTITFTISGATNNQPFIISILQGNTTLSTISSWFATVRWAGGSVPTLTATLNKRDTFGFIRTGANTYDGFIIGQNC